MKFDRLLIVIAIAAFFFNLALGLQNTMHMNFVSDELGIEAEQIGALDGIREIPGLLTAVLALAALLFTESILAALCLGAVSLGLLLYGQATGFSDIAVATIILSMGFHLYSPVQNSILLRTSSPAERGRRLGFISGIAALATLLASLTVRFFEPVAGMRTLLQWAAVMALIGAAVQAFGRRSEKAQISKGIVFNWKYKTYYSLTLLGGSRRQINHTFARLALVTLYGVPVTTMATLMLINSLLSIVTRPIFGRLIDKLGESRSLTINYALITGVFLAYAFVPLRGVLYLAFIVDHLMLGFDIGVTTHLDKIAVRQDVGPSLAMGSTINHITGVIVPVLGGVMWARFGHQSVFLLGTFICLLSLWQAIRLPAYDETEQSEALA